MKPVSSHLPHKLTYSIDIKVVIKKTVNVRRQTMRIGNLKLPLAVGALLSLVAIVAIGCGSAEVSGLEEGVGANVIEVT